MSRRSVLILAVLSLFVSVADARAGTFEVLACDAAPGFTNNSWRSDVNHGGMLTYTACPAGDNQRLGLGARHHEQPSG